MRNLYKINKIKKKKWMRYEINVNKTVDKKQFRSYDMSCRK